MNHFISLLENISVTHDWQSFVRLMFTSNEIIELEERILILQKLIAGETQRQIAQELGVSITTVTRGNKALKWVSPALREMITNTGVVSKKKSSSTKRVTKK